MNITVCVKDSPPKHSGTVCLPVSHHSGYDFEVLLQTCILSVQQQSHSFAWLNSNVSQEVKTDHKWSLDMHLRYALMLVSLCQFKPQTGSMLKQDSKCEPSC